MCSRGGASSEDSLYARFSLFVGGWLAFEGDAGEAIETGEALLEEVRFAGARLALDPGT